MSFTISKSGENYRDYWPQKGMTDFVTHSLDLIDDLKKDDSENLIHLNEVGYDFISETSIDIFPSSYDRSSIKNNASQAFDRITDAEEIIRSKPYFSESANQVVHINRAGIMDVYGLGSHPLNKTKAKGVIFKQATIENLSYENERYTVSLTGESKALKTEQLILTAGPNVADLAQMLDIDLPIENYLQHKFVIPDIKQLIPRDLPFTFRICESNTNTHCTVLGLLHSN